MRTPSFQNIQGFLGDMNKRFMSNVLPKPRKKKVKSQRCLKEEYEIQKNLELELLQMEYRSVINSQLLR